VCGSFKISWGQEADTNRGWCATAREKAAVSYLCVHRAKARAQMNVSGYRVQGSGFRVQGSGFRVQGSGLRVQGSGFRVQGSEYRVQRARARAHMHAGVGAPHLRETQGGKYLPR
jgi:hypothetical protein